MVTGTLKPLLSSWRYGERLTGTFGCGSRVAITRRGSRRLAPGDPRRWAASRQHALLRDSRRIDFHPSCPWKTTCSTGEQTNRRRFNSMQLFYSHAVAVIHLQLKSKSIDHISGLRLTSIFHGQNASRAAASSWQQRQRVHFVRCGPPSPHHQDERRLGRHREDWEESAQPDHDGKWD